MKLTFKEDVELLEIKKRELAYDMEEVMFAAVISSIVRSVISELDPKLDTMVVENTAYDILDKTITYDEFKAKAAVSESYEAKSILGYVTGISQKYQDLIVESKSVDGVKKVKQDMAEFIRSKEDFGLNSIVGVIRKAIRKNEEDKEKDEEKKQDLLDVDNDVDDKDMEDNIETDVNEPAVDEDEVVTDPDDKAKEEDESEEELPEPETEEEKDDIIAECLCGLGSSIDILYAEVASKLPTDAKMDLEHKRKEAYELMNGMRDVEKRGGNTESYYDEYIKPFIKGLLQFLLLFVIGFATGIVMVIALASGVFGILFLILAGSLLLLAADKKQKKIQSVLDEFDDQILAVDQALIEYGHDADKVAALKSLRMELVTQRKKYARKNYVQTSADGNTTIRYTESKAKNIYVKNMRLANKKFKIGESLGKQEPSIDDVKGLVIQKVTEEVSSDSSKDISEESIKIVILVTVTIMNIFCELNILTKKEFYKRVVGA